MKRPVLILFLFSIIFPQDELILEKGARYQGVIILVNEHKVHFKANNVAYLNPVRVSEIKKLTSEKKLLIQDGKWKIDVQQYIDFNEVLRADPNKSLYLFAPSAFPIGNKEKYCRDFCVFFPSYNIGLGNYSMQFGAFLVSNKYW